MPTDDIVLFQDVKSLLSQKTPLLPHEELHSFVEHYFSLRHRYLQVIEKHPPPLYILESTILKQRAYQFQKAFKEVFPEVSFYYAFKSNNYPEVAKILLQAEFGLDISSGNELEIALNLGANDIVFSGPGKTDQELSLATIHAEKVIFLIDSFGELHRLNKIAASHDKIVKAGVRLTTVESGLWRKFGISLGSLSDFWKDVTQCANVMFNGLQFHTSWNLSPEPQIDFIQALGKALERMPYQFRRNIQFIDIGGGYWPSQGDWLQPAGTPPGKILKALGKGGISPMIHHRLPSMPIEIFAEKLSTAIQKNLHCIAPLRVFLEPGRWICNDAMHLFVSVIDKKASDMVITDAGTNAVGWERFESDYFPILNLTRPSLNEMACDILGSLCTPHDVWGYSYWGKEIQPGDQLIVLCGEKIVLDGVVEEGEGACD